MTPRLLRQPPRSVLLVRLSARGDIVFSSPLVRAFRRTYPDVKITWMAESHTKDLIERHPELDELIVVDRNGWKRDLKAGRLASVGGEVADVVGTLRNQEFDLAIDLQGLLRSGLMVYLSGAPIRIGLGSREGSQHLMTHVLSRYGGDRRRMSSEYRFLAEELDLDVGDFRMEVPLAPEDREWADAKVAELGLEGGFFVPLPFTTTPQKHWREKRWAQLMDRVADELGLPAVVLGGPDDVPAMERIGDLARSGPASLVGATTLTQASAMVEKASLVIGVDTGLTHMAIAFDRPTVTLFGSNIPYTLPPTDRAKVIVHWLDCSPCRSNPTCGGAFTCTELITVDQVMETALEVLANAGEGRGTFGAQDPGRASGAGEPGNASQNPGSHPSTSGNASQDPGA